MIKSLFNKYIETHQIIKDLKPKNWLHLNLLGLFFTFSLFGIGYLILYIFDISNHFIYGWILFQIVSISCFFVIYHLYHRELQKTHSVSYNTKNLFLIDFLQFLTLLIGIQTILLFYAYSAATIPILLILCLILSSLLLTLWIVITVHLADLELYYKQFHLFITLILFHIILMRFVPLSAIWIYVISIILAYTIWLLIYELKPSLDHLNPVKLSKTIVYIISGTLLFVTLMITFPSYKSYFYEDIQIQSKLNTSLIYAFDQDSSNYHSSIYALDGTYTYIQIGRKLIVLEDDEIIHKLDLPEDHKLMASSNSFIIAHMKEFIQDNTEDFPYLYDFYGFDSNFEYIKTNSIAMPYEIYGLVSHDGIDYYVGGGVFFIFENNTHLKTTIFAFVESSTDNRVTPVFNNQNLVGFNLFHQENQILLHSHFISVRLPWIEQSGDILISSLSWQNSSESILIMDANTLEGISKFDRVTYDGYSYLNMNDYQFLMNRGILSIYDNNGVFIEDVVMKSTSLLMTDQSILLDIYSFSPNYDKVSSELYILDMDQPYIYGTSSENSISRVIFTLSLCFVYLIIDRRQIAK